MSELVENRSALPRIPVVRLGVQPGLGSLFGTIFIIILLGFIPSYFAKLLSTSFPWQIHFHAIMMLSWFVVILLQVSFARAGKFHLHRAIGKTTYFQVPLLVLATALLIKWSVLKNIELGVPSKVLGFMWVSISDVLMFVLFYVFAIFTKHRQELHLRFMVAATLMLLPPAIVRLPLQRLHLPSWLSPLHFAGIIVVSWLFTLLLRDRGRGRVLPAYPLCLAVCLFVLVTRSVVQGSEHWRRLAQFLVGIPAYQEKLVPTSGAMIRLRERPVPGRPVLLIHGGPGGAGYMISLADLLPSFHTVEYFQRDITNSPSKGAFSVETHVNDLRDLVRHYARISGKKPVLLGHSFGATLALEYGKKYSDDQVEKIVLISPGTMTRSMEEQFDRNLFSRSKDEKRARDLFKLLKASEGKPEYPSIRKEYMGVIGRSYFFDYDHAEHDEMDKTALPHPEKNAAAYIAASKDSWNKVRAGTYVADLEKINCPVIHFQADYDINPATEIMGILKPRIKNYRLIELGHSGHIPWLEAQVRPTLVQQLKLVLSERNSGVL